VIFTKPISADLYYPTKLTHIGSGILIVLVVKSSVFWDIMPSDPLKIDRRFGGTYLHLLGWIINQARNQHETCSMLVSFLAYSWLWREAKCSSETLVDFERTIRRHGPEDITLRCKPWFWHLFLLQNKSNNYSCCRKYFVLHNEELHNLYSSPSIIRVIKSRKMRLARHVARMGEKRNAYSILVGKPAGKRPLGRWRRRWMENTEMDLRGTGWNGMNWWESQQEREH
jgi:hypothetical protein